jgi:hypothetical protein
MRRLSLSAAALLALASPLVAGAQVLRSADAGAGWQSDAPQIRVWIDGPRAFDFGQPVPVHYWVSDDAYVIVATVNGSGRLAVLSPVTRTGRTFVHGNIERVLLGRHVPSGQGAFYASGGGVLSGGFVFAIASWQPFDLSTLENRDFDGLGLESRFSLANRAYVTNPDEYIARFASWVTWDADTPYDYDVDYYSSTVASPFGSVASLCFGGSRTALLWSDWYANPYSGMCSGYLNSLAFCYGFSAFSYTPYCGAYGRGPRVVSLPLAPVVPVTDSTRAVNVGLIRAGLWAPDTVGVVADQPDAAEEQRPKDANGKPGTLLPFIGSTSEPVPTYFALPERGIETLKRGAAAGTREATGNRQDLGSRLLKTKLATGTDASRPKSAPSATRAPVPPPVRAQPERPAPPRAARAAPRRGTTNARDPYAMPTVRPATRGTASSPTTRPAPSSGDVRSSTGSGKGASGKTSPKPKKPPE